MNYDEARTYVDDWANAAIDYTAGTDEKIRAIKHARSEVLALLQPPRLQNQGLRVGQPVPASFATIAHALNLTPDELRDRIDSPEGVTLPQALSAVVELANGLGESLEHAKTVMQAQESLLHDCAKRNAELRRPVEIVGYVYDGRAEGEVGFLSVDAYSRVCRFDNAEDEGGYADPSDDWAPVAKVPR